MREWMKRFNGAFQNICSFKIIVSDLLQALCESPQFGRQQVNEQERQCTYNVTLKSVHETTVVESYNYYKRDCVCACVCVCECSGAWAWMLVRACILAYPECNSYATNCYVIYGPSSSAMFFDIISYTAQFSEIELLKIKRVFLFYLQHLSKTLLMLGRI